MAEPSGTAGTGTSTGMWIGRAVAGAVALAVVYLLVTSGRDPVAPPAERPAADTRPETQAPPAATAPPVAAETETAAPAEKPENAALDPPGFDVVRASPDGSALVAGTAPAGARVEVLVDGIPADAQVVDGSGSFVFFLTLETSAAPRVLTLEASLDGRVAASEDQIILAPGPAPVAETAPSAEPVAGSTPAPAPVAEDIPETLAEATEAPDAPVAERGETAGETPVDPAPETSVAATAPSVTEPAPDTGAPVARAAAPDPATGDASTDAAAAPEAPVAAAPVTPPPAAPVAVLRADASGVEVLQPATPILPDAVDRLALDTISYSEAGEVQLSGRAGRETVIRVYLDNRAVTDLPADPDGRWRGLLDDIAPGDYTLRLDALDASGQVVSRLETPFRREAPATLAATGEAGSGIRAVTVQAGDTLWAISRARYGDGVLFVKLLEANGDQIVDPDLIYPGQVFAIPD